MRKICPKCFPSRPAQFTARSILEHLQLAPKLTNGDKDYYISFSYIAACLFCFLQIRVASCQYFNTDQKFSSKFTPKLRKLRLICFRNKMCKKLVCVLILQFKGSCFFQLQTFTPTLLNTTLLYIVFGLNVPGVNLPQ